ncbi:hypothetical protein J6590_015000 [Homalodisca vitripennis]|nr:hypothetical protein J6590_015000 [Homalodisca vitripennis]
MYIARLKGVVGGVSEGGGGTRRPIKSLSGPPLHPLIRLHRLFCFGQQLTGFWHDFGFAVLISLLHFYDGVEAGRVGRGGEKGWMNHQLLVVVGFP